MKVQALTDGRTVWVNGEDGTSVGRFGPVYGGVRMDVHTVDGSGCLACAAFKDPAEGWRAFRDRMKEHHGLDIPEKVWKPGGKLSGMRKMPVKHAG